MIPQAKLPESVLSVWHYEEPGQQRGAFIGEPAFWRWPRANLKPLRRRYGLFGAIIVLPVVVLSLIAAPTTVIAPGGEIIRSFSGHYLTIAVVVAGIYLAIPILLGLRRRTYWRAEPGSLTIAGEKIPIDLTVELRLINYDYTTRHGQGIQKIQKTRRLLNVEVKTPQHIKGKIIATFSERDLAVVKAALENLAKISGATFRQS